MKKPSRVTVHIVVQGKADIKFDFENSDDLKLLDKIVTKITKEVIAPNYPIKLK